MLCDYSEPSFRCYKPYMYVCVLQKLTYINFHACTVQTSQLPLIASETGFMRRHIPLPHPQPTWPIKFASFMHYLTMKIIGLTVDYVADAHDDPLTNHENWYGSTTTQLFVCDHMYQPGLAQGKTMVEGCRASRAVQLTQKGAALPYFGTHTMWASNLNGTLGPNLSFLSPMYDLSQVPTQVTSLFQHAKKSAYFL